MQHITTKKWDSDLSKNLILPPLYLPLYLLDCKGVHNLLMKSLFVVVECIFPSHRMQC